MKGIIVAVVLATVFTVGLCHPGMHETFFKHAQECLEKNNVPEQAVADLQKLKDDSSKVPDNVKCALHCMMTKGGFMDDKGKVIPDAIKAELKENEQKAFEEGLKECGAVEGKDPCDTTFLTFACMIKYNS